MGARRRCCCKCWTWGDTFTRPNSTNIGADWNEYGGGDWSIVSSQLKETTGTDNSFAITIHQNPKLSLTGLATVTAKNIVQSAVYGLIINFKDVNNYLWLTFYTDGVDSFLRLGQVAGGVLTSYASESADSTAPIGEDVVLHLCRGPDGVWGSVEAVGISHLSNYACLGDGLPEAGYRAGVANFSDTGETVTFDNFSFEEHEYTNPDCRGCACSCESHCPPKQLVATVFDATGDCAGCDGEEADLTWENTPEGSKWNGAFSAYCWPYFELTDIALWCLSNQCSEGSLNFSLCSIHDSILACGWEAADGSNNCQDIGGNGMACPNGNSYCSPFYLEFGPFTCEAGHPGGGTCSYKIAITEKP